MNDEDRRLEKLYTQVMERHGTPAYTEADEEFAQNYRADKKAREDAERGDDVSPGSNSEPSENSTQKSDADLVKSPPSPVRTTESHSKQGQATSATVPPTDGSGRKTK